ncbi:MAG: type IV secretory system conjugative DNA transfer family protein [Azoarcus sp. PHD]|nr:MAG: type IV secretory system conjugative DNA transfer family protein [Azoarcus sp. PHD]
MSGKTLAILGAVLAYVVVGFFAAEYIAGGAYFVVNKSIPTDITLDTWSQYWDWYSDDPVQRKRLQMSAGIAGILVYLVPLMIFSAVRSGGRSLHGDARFAVASEVRKAGLYEETGIIVGKYNGRYLMFDGQNFVLLAAPTRSGKGVAIVLPNLLNYGGSVVVLDIKLENFKLTSGFRAAHGQRVFLFNPFAEDGKTHRWNPLDGISRNRNFRVGDVLAIGQALYPSDNVKEAFWNDQARNLFLGLTLYLLETPELPCTLGELLRQSSGKGQPIKDYLQGVMAERMNGDNALSDECLDAINRFCSTSENTMASILATFNAPLTIFANPIVDAATSASDIDVTMVRKELMSIYIGIQPNRLADASLLINLFFSQLINLNTKELPADNPALKHQCLLILDEFTAIGKVGIIAKAVSYIAGYNIRLLPIIQSISQLESVYGEKDTRTFVTNHALQVLYPPREQKDANEYSEMLGYFTEKSVSTGVSRPRAWGSNNASSSENTSDQRRALLLPQELKELGQDKEIIILENTKPILCEKARYFSDESFIDRLKAISPTLAALGKKLPSKDQLEQAAFVRNELASPVPALDIDLHKAKMERRIRTAEPDEPIDLAKLAVDVDALPAIDSPENPSEEQVAGLVDAFFSQLDWVDENTGEFGEAPAAGGVIEFGGAAPIAEASETPAIATGGGEIEPVFAAEEPLDEPGDDYFDEPEDAIDAGPAPTAPFVRTKPQSGTIDLAVLDQ